MKRFLSLFVGTLFLTACAIEPVSTDKLVAATIYPLAHLVQQVGGEFATVIQATPGGMELHDFEPTAKIIADIMEADMLIVNGAGVDAWAETIAEDIATAGGRVLHMSDHLTMLAVEEEEHEEHEDEHGHGDMDPHVWLDPLLVIGEVQLIARTLGEADPQHAATYDANAQRYIAELQALDTKIRDGLEGCAQRTIVVAHDAFRYFGHRYDLRIVPVAGLSPEEEPSPKAMAEIVKLVRAENVDTIFFETLTSPALAQTLADEAGAKTSILNPLEGLTAEEEAQGATYLSIMEENLRNLRTALQCPSL